MNRIAIIREFGYMLALAGIGLASLESAGMTQLNSTDAPYFVLGGIGLLFVALMAELIVQLGADYAEEVGA